MTERDRSLRRDLFTPTALAVMIWVTFLLTDHNQNIVGFGSSNNSLDSVNPASTLARLALCVLAVGLVARVPRRRWGITNPALLAAVAYGAFASISLAWSGDLAFSARKLFVLGVLALTAFALANAFQIDVLVAIIVAVAAGFLIVGLAYELATDSVWIGNYRFSGTTGPNQNGMYAALLVLYGLCQLLTADVQRRRRMAGLALIIVGLGFTAITKSRTAIVGLAVAALAVTLLARRWRPALRAPAPAAVLGVVAIGAISGFLRVGPTRSGNLSSFGNRTTIWDRLWPDIGDRLIAGHGYMAYWTRPDSTGFRDVHSGYISVLLDGGVLGVTLYALALLAALATAWAVPHVDRGPDTAFVFAVTTFALVHAFGDTSFKHPTFMLFALLTLSFALSTRYRSSGSTASAANATSPAGSNGLGKNETASAPAATIEST